MMKQSSVDLLIDDQKTTKYLMALALQDRLSKTGILLWTELSHGDPQFSTCLT
jgi:hypothetical protein